MKLVSLLLAAILLFGCINFNHGQQNNTVNNTLNTSNTSSNSTNQTNPANQSAQQQPNPEASYNTSEFSFQYPSDMQYQFSNSNGQGVFTGIHNVNNNTFEMLIVTYVNTTSAYGANQDHLFQANPSLAASTTLLQDNNNDPASILDTALTIGNVSTYSIARDGGAGEEPFTTDFQNSTRTFSGYGINIYVPERSILVRVRILALDPSIASSIRQNFILSFHPE